LLNEMPLNLRMDRQLTADRLAIALRMAILRGELAQGEPLREASISSSAGVARNTVREALRLLTNEGLVTHHAFRGVSVTQLSDVDVADIFQARRALELAGIGAIADLTEQGLDDLEQAASGFEEAVDREDWPSAFQHDIDLHAALVAGWASDRLSASFQGLMRELRLAYLMFDGLQTESLPIDREEHRRIVELVRASDDAACRELIVAHLARSEQLLLELMRSHRERSAVREAER
jgi:DNA-binding GntR family transcriptional regulator